MEPRSKTIERRKFKTHSDTSICSSRSLTNHPRIEIASIDRLKPSPHNTRTHSKRQIRQLANSITRFGWSAPIVIDERGTILAGHARYEAAKLIGLDVAPVIILVGLKEAEKRAFALADNKIAANAAWDPKVLAQELGDLDKLLPELSLSLEITGFESAEIRSLLGELSDPIAHPVDNVPTPKTKLINRHKIKAVSRTGDLWKLGPHKILCGDALLANEVPRLLSGKAAAIIIMGPPYILPIRRIKGVGDYSDDMTAAQFTHFVRDSLSHDAKRSLSDAMHLVVMDWPRLRREIGAGSVLPPLCADAAVRCWQAHTKQSAILETTGQSFDAVAAARGKSGGSS
jgi:ParB-like nuclease family protein